MYRERIKESQQNLLRRLCGEAWGGGGGVGEWVGEYSRSTAAFKRRLNKTKKI